ncbi:TonB-dependent receptor [Brevundimonas sp.]|uniref:TonB-dependent receptor n=1 Tax=Brevundimonas sp. TaxID=1871086 RepID=UPI002FCA075B
MNRLSHHRLFGAVLIWLFGVTNVQAQEARRLSIPAQPMTTAVLQLGAQTRVSIGAQAAAGCGRANAVAGIHGVEAALRIMLAGSGCTFRRTGRRTYVIVGAPPPPPPQRQEPAPASPVVVSGLDDVVVTATRRELNLAGAPYSLSAVDGASFDAAARRDTSALATRLAGLTVTNLGPGRNKLFVRGLADSPLTGQTQAMVGLYLDETRLTYDAPDPDLRLVDLERVELLRGPQSTLYGAGTLGGVLKLISHPPVLDEYQVEVAAGLTFADNTSPGHSVDLVFNAPLVRDRIAVRAVLYEERLEGVVDDPGLGLSNTGKSLRYGIRPSLVWRINDAWEARVGGVFQTLHIDDSQYGFESLPAYERVLSLPEPSNNDFNGVSLTAEGAYDWGVIKFSSAYQGHDLDRRYDATTASARFGGTGAPLAYDEIDSIRAFAMETSVTSPPARSFNWLAGLYVSHYSHDRTGEMIEPDSGLLLYDTVKQDETNEAAVFGEIAWAPNSRLKITLGGRYFNAATDSSTDARRRGVLSDAYEGRLEDDDFSTKAVVEYAFRDDVLIYAQASQGYRMGGFNGGAVLDGIYGEPGAGPQPYRAFQPDALFSHEVGLRWRALDDRLALRFSAFLVDWRSVQSDRISRDGLPFTANIGSADNSGLEIEGVWRDDDWRVDFNLMANDPRLNAEDSGYPLATDSDLPGVPKFLGAISARREGFVFGLPGWVSGTLGYVGPSRQRLTPATVTDMGDYVTSELAANVALGAWSATMRLDNLFGGAGDTFGYGNPFLVDRQTVITPQRPRNLSLSLSRQF